MQRHNGDGALKRIIGEFAALDPEDSDAIMQALEPRARHQVLAMLDNYKQPAAVYDQAENTAGIFSDWLSERIVGRSFMTEAARAALRLCAAEIAGSKRTVLFDVAATPPSLLSRLTGALRRSARRS